MRNIENEADYLVNAVERFAEIRRAVLRSVGYRANLTEDEVRAMVVILRSNGPISEAIVASALDVSLPSCRSLLSQLVQREIIEMVPGVPDSEAAFVTATVDPTGDPWRDLTAFEKAVDRGVAAIDERLMADTIAAVSQVADAVVRVDEEAAQVLLQWSNRR